ncbi:hypothetical protein GCM10023323_23610 [Streptomyces thinghirensis]|uniref:Uncharacterized protein n=1 Tax=Streptomyces thinghirensis TaxID=551547 RepID=A0ABP9T3Z9_9ACTN
MEDGGAGSACGRLPFSHQARLSLGHIGDTSDDLQHAGSLSAPSDIARGAFQVNWLVSMGVWSTGRVIVWQPPSGARIPPFWHG